MKIEILIIIGEIQESIPYVSVCQWMYKKEKRQEASDMFLRIMEMTGMKGPRRKRLIRIKSVVALTTS